MFRPLQGHLQEGLYKGMQNETNSIKDVSYLTITVLYCKNTHTFLTQSAVLL